MFGSPDTEEIIWIWCSDAIYHLTNSCTWATSTRIIELSPMVRRDWVFLYADGITKNHFFVLVSDEKSKCLPTHYRSECLLRFLFCCSVRKPKFQNAVLYMKEGHLFHNELLIKEATYYHIYVQWDLRVAMDKAAAMYTIPLWSIQMKLHGG